MQRFFLNPAWFRKDSIDIRDQKLLHQIQHVLRMRADEKFIALDNTGFEYVCELKNLQKEQADADIVEKRKNMAEPSIRITLYQALPKKMELFEWVLQKGTEIGISKFVPLITERTGRTSLPKRERMEKILKEAAEQCERGKIPELRDLVELRDVFKQKLEHPILLHNRGDHYFLFSQLSKIKGWKQLKLFVGPEGGFSESEIAEAKKKGALIASLGPRVLRTETAGIVAAGIVLM